MFKWHVCLNIFAVIQLSVSECLTSGKDTLNVGTVLFEEADIYREAWTKDSISLLNSRRLMQDLLPTKVVDVSCDKYISTFINYVHSALDHVRNETEGRSQQLMLYALGDTIGGYLRTYLLPVTKEAYYSGNLQYNETRRLFAMYEDIKNLLKTTGEGWSKPREVPHKHSKLSSLKITFANSNDACDDFILHETCGEISIPIPYLDDKCSPNSIALPIKTEGLISLHAASSAYVVQKYYVGAVKCLLSYNNTQKSILQFSSKVEKWLKTSVVPHLDEETWYPAFGGIFRILMTIRRLEMRTQVPHKQHKRENERETDETTTPSNNEKDYSANGGYHAFPGSQILAPVLPPGYLYPAGYPDGSSVPIDTGFTGRFNPFDGTRVIDIPEASHYEGRIPKGNHNIPIFEGIHDGSQINAPELKIAGRYSGNVLGEDVAGGVPEVVFRDEGEPYEAGAEEGAVNSGDVEAGGDEEDDDDDEEEEDTPGATDGNPPADEGDGACAGAGVGADAGAQVEGDNKNVAVSNIDQASALESQQGSCCTKKHVEMSGCHVKDILDSLNPIMISALVISPDLTFLSILLAGVVWTLIAFIFMLLNHDSANLYLSEEEARGKLFIDYIGEKRKKAQDRRYRIHLKSCPNEKRKKVYSDVKEGGPAFTKYFHTYFSLCCPGPKKNEIDSEQGRKDPFIRLPLTKPRSARVISLSRASTTQSDYSLEMEDDEDEDDDVSSGQVEIVRRQSSSGESFAARDAHGNRLDSIYDEYEPVEEEEEGEEGEREGEAEDGNEEQRSAHGNNTGRPRFVQR